MRYTEQLQCTDFLDDPVEAEYYYVRRLKYALIDRVPVDLVKKSVTHYSKTLTLDLFICEYKDYELTVKNEVQKQLRNLIASLES